jgi:hypothetical protein
MAFADYLGQIFGKRTAWLYRIVIPGATTYHVTSRGRDYTSSADKPDATFVSTTNWTSTAILTGGVTQTTRAERAEVKVNLPTTGDIAQAILAYDGQADITVSIWQTFVGDPDEEYAVKFVGRVVNVQPGLLAVTLICEEGFTAMNRSSVAQVMQRLCRHAHYFTTDDGGGCRLNVDDWKQAVTITDMAGRVVTVPLAAMQPEGTLTAGILFWGGGEYFIQEHVGELLTLEAVPNGLAAALAGGDESADVAPGCDLTPERCVDFENIANFGGFWWMTETPFDGRALG